MHFHWPLIGLCMHISLQHYLDPVTLLDSDRYVDCVWWLVVVELLTEEEEE